MLRPKMWRMSGVIANEMDYRPAVEAVTGRQIEFNTIRFPLSLRYGATSKIEVGADIQFEQNQGVSVDAARIFGGSGLSYLDVVMKYKVIPWTTFIGRLGLFGTNNLYDGGDKFDLGMDVLVTLPLNLPIGIPNLMHFNTGVRLKSGDPDIDNNGRPDLRGYATPIHLGWSLVVAPWNRWALVAELFASRSPFGLEEQAEISLGGRFAYTDRTVLHGSLVHGVAKGSPAFALRFGIQTTFGSLTERHIVRTDIHQKMPKELPLEKTPQIEMSVNRMLAIASSAYQRGDYVAAADAFSELVSRIPSDGRVYYNLGVCYYKLKDYPRAEGEFLKALTLVSNDAEIYLYLGHCQFMQGRVMDAKANWEETLRLDPGNDLAKFLLSNIR